MSESIACRRCRFVRQRGQSGLQDKCTHPDAGVFFNAFLGLKGGDPVCMQVNRDGACELFKPDTPDAPTGESPSVPHGSKDTDA